MKFLREELYKAKDSINNKIEGYPRVERGIISPFSFCRQFLNIPTTLGFSWNPLRERPKQLHLNNTLPSENYTWNSLGLQLTQKKTRSRKNSLRLHHSVFWLACGRKSRWNMTANQKTANHKYCFSTNQRKKQNLVFWTWMSSPRLNTGKEAMIAGYRWCPAPRVPIKAACLICMFEK